MQARAVVMPPLRFSTQVDFSATASEAPTAAAGYPHRVQPRVAAKILANLAWRATPLLEKLHTAGARTAERSGWPCFTRRSHVIHRQREQQGPGCLRTLRRPSERERCGRLPRCGHTEKRDDVAGPCISCMHACNSPATLQLACYSPATRLLLGCFRGTSCMH